MTPGHHIARRPVTDALRRSIVEDLPEIDDIEDDELRAKVIEGWAYSLSGSSFERISDMPGEGNPNVLVLRAATRPIHLRGVALLAMKIVETFEATHPEVRIDRDIVLAGALCHDIGKPYEFDPVNMKRWARGSLALRRSPPCAIRSTARMSASRSACPRRSRISRSAIRSRGSISGSAPSATSCATPTIPGGTSRAPRPARAGIARRRRHDDAGPRPRRVAAMKARDQPAAPKRASTVWSRIRAALARVVRLGLRLSAHRCRRS